MRVETAKKSNIEAILPLSELQQGMLIHHLYYPRQDQGFLHVSFRLKGQLVKNSFEKAWELAVERHSILRTTVHWEKMDKPVQVIHADKAPHWTFLDWSEIASEEQDKKLDRLKSAQKEAGTNFKNPLTDFYLIALGRNEHFFLWPCHHLLIDGWSGNNVVKDVLAFYDALCNNEELTLQTLPSLKSYYSWLGNKDSGEAAKFWSGYFDGFQETHLFNTGANPEEDKNIVKSIQLTENETIGINNFAKSVQVSPNTLIQGAWSLLLGKYFNTDDVVFGASVSGRSNDFPNMHLLAGMFMNVLPIRNRIEGESSLKEWLHAFQKKQIRAMEYEHVTLNQISSYINKEDQSLWFDSLLVFENFPWKKIKSGSVDILEYRGGVTSNYPISLMVIPDDLLEFNFLFKDGQVTEETREWIVENWRQILKMLGSEKITSVQELSDHIVAPEPDKINLKDGRPRKGVDTKFVAPRSEIERKLAKIWRSLLGIDAIGVRDNYFELGGKSLMAIKMFSIIEKKFKKKLPPTTLLFNPTIEEIAIKLGQDKDDELPDWEYIVPLRTEGTKKPLFCIHGGEGHILFYKSLPEHVDRERPVYTLQPKGVNGDGPMHASIEEMGRDYLSEIEKIQPRGPYNLLFYCYSPLGAEMAKLLEDKGEQANLIMVDGMAQPTEKIQKMGIRERLVAFMKKFREAPMASLRSSLGYRYRRYLEPYYLKLTNNKHLELLIRIRKSLEKCYYAYTWQKFDAKCTLILTTSEHRELSRKKIATWEYWCKSSVKVLYNSGNHYNLFYGPRVKELGGNVEKVCL